jgi:macrolide-specific efflux system membrane fusion protein
VKGSRLMRRRVVVPVAVVALVAVGTGAWALLRPTSSAAAVTYRETAVTTGTVRQAVSASGTIAPATTSDLSFTAAGQVTAVYVAVGAKVAKGQKLAAIDSASLRSAVASAQATLASAQARLASDESAGASDAQVAADGADVTVAASQVSDAQAALAGATLTSPIAGTVTAVNVTVGQQLAGGTSSGGGGSGSGGGGSGTDTGTGSTAAATTAAVQVVSTGAYLVNAGVDATDVALIKKGNQVVITPTGAAANVFGLVTSVGIVASSTSGVATFPVVVAVTGSPAGLYAGGGADLQIVYKQVSNVLVVPTLAISRANGTATVLVADAGGGRTERQVVTGLSSGGQTQIVSGLAEGEQVLVAVPGGNTGTTGGRGGTQRGGEPGVFPGGGFPGGGGRFGTGNGGTARNGGGGS